MKILLLSGVVCLAGFGTYVVGVDTSIKVFAAMGWVLTAVSWFIGAKIGTSIQDLRRDLIENHIMPMRADIREIKATIRLYDK